MKRHLAAVLAADIRDYSRLIGEDMFGDGGNIPARSETGAAPGSMTVSNAGIGRLDGVSQPAFDDTEAWGLKNIERPGLDWARLDWARLDSVSARSD